MSQTPSSVSSSTDPPAKKKRGADRQITKDDREEPDEDDNDAVDLSRNIRTDPDLFKASDAVLKQRKIVKVARKANGTVDWSKKKSSNPFAAVNLKANNDKSENNDDNNKKEEEKTRATTTTIFGSSTGFSGFGSTTSSGGGGFGSTTSSSGFGGFGSINNNSKSNNNNDKAPTLSFGSAKGFASVAAASGSMGFTFGSSASTSQNKRDKKEDDDDKKEETGTVDQTKKDNATGNDEKDNQTETARSEKDASASKDTAAGEANSILPTEYQVESGEENETLLLECRCKTHRWGTTTATANSSVKDKATEEKPAVAAVPHSETGFSASGPNAAKEKKDDNGDKVENKEDEEKDNKKVSSEAAASQTSSKNAWHEVGVGPLRVLQAVPQDDKNTDKEKDDTDESKATTSEPSESSLPKQPHSVRLVQRRQVNPSAAPTKVLLNVRLFAESTVSQPSEKHVQLTTPMPGAAASTTTAPTTGGNENEGAAATTTATNSSSSSSTYLFKCGKAATAHELFECLQKEIKSAPPCFTKKD